MIDVNEGRKNMYLIQGIFVLIIGTVFFVMGFSSMILLSFLGAIIVALAVLMFTASNGLQIDTELNRYRQYANIGGYYNGGWTDFGLVESAQLVLTSENIYRAGMATQSRANSMSSSIIKTYDVQFILKSSKVITIFEFDKYKHAKQVLKKIEEKMEIPVSNQIAEKMVANRRFRR
ncbi:MAG: hypothetical protein ACJASQ_002521 [Crocinitomicaceae bacterium]|jgi:hypothetical protein